MPTQGEMLNANMEVMVAWLPEVGSTVVVARTTAMITALALAALAIAVSGYGRSHSCIVCSHWSCCYCN